MITDVNPFVYSRPVPPEDVLDRDAETAELLAKAVGGHYVRLYAPRKYGKTSLLNRVLRDAERDEGLIPVLVDLYRVLSIADVTIRFERAYARHLKGAVRARVEEFLQRFETKCRPLYGSAVPMRLGRLPDDAVAEYVAGRFADGGRGVGEALNPLMRTAAGHPQRSIMLAHHLWQQVAQGEVGTLSDWS